MLRVGGGAVYAFSDRLFRELLAIDGVSLATVTRDGGVICAALFVASGDTLFYFLSASTSAARPLKATNFLLDRVIAEARDAGFRWLHLGGGAPSLRHFKGQVASGSVPYFVRRRVHDEAAYEALRRATASTESGDFPAYRSALVVAQRGG
jgi:hypothetical protein